VHKSFSGSVFLTCFTSVPAVIVGGIDMMSQSLVLAKKPHIVIGKSIDKSIMSWARSALVSVFLIYTLHLYFLIKFLFRYCENSQISYFSVRAEVKRRKTVESHYSWL